jgi:hypothetical protein
MFSWKPFMTAVGMLLMTTSLYSQDSDSAFNFTGIIYNKAFEPIAATHVINVNTQRGDVSDSLGIFTLPVHLGDTLWFRNIAFQETLAPVAGILEQRYIILKSVFYPLQEARIFTWGSSYEDFSEAVINTPAPQTLGESLGLPRQDPDYIPFDMDQSRLKSTGFLLRSPISFLYYNLSRKEKNRRKLFWNKKNQESNERFDAIVSSENLSNITGLSGDQLVEFMSYLFQKMVCDYKCTELKIYSEIYAHWDVFQHLHPEISTK